MTKSTSAHKPQPEPANITYEWVRDTLRGAAHIKHPWYAVHEIIDLMNGWDGHSRWPHESLQKARQKLQLAPGHATHQHPTSTQSAAVRRQLALLVEEKLVEKQRGGARSNNGFSYRWITPAILHQKMHQQNLAAHAHALAQRITLALGGANTRPLLVHAGSRNVVEIQVTLSEQVAEKLLAVLGETGFSGDYFKGKHYEIIRELTGTVIGCCTDREAGQQSEPGVVFREVSPADCSSCYGLVCPHSKDT